MSPRTNPSKSLLISGMACERARESAMRREIKGLVKACNRSIDKRIVEEAARVGNAFLRSNPRTDPTTLGRVSFYVAMKQFRFSEEECMELLFERRGKNNIWWTYLIPLVEGKSKGHR